MFVDETDEEQVYGMRELLAKNQRDVRVHTTTRFPHRLEAGRHHIDTYICMLHTHAHMYDVTHTHAHMITCMHAHVYSLLNHKIDLVRESRFTATNGACLSVDGACNLHHPIWIRKNARKKVVRGRPTLSPWSPNHMTMQKQLIM